MPDREPERAFLVRFLACVVRGHTWDPYPQHLRGEGLMQCARCGMRARPMHGLEA